MVALIPAREMAKGLAIALVAFVAVYAAGDEAQASVDFGRDIRPILSERCFTCHGPDEGTRLSALRFDTEQGAFAELASGEFAIVRGSPEDSQLIERITSENPALRMPPAYQGHDRLPDNEIATLRRWIEEGAPWARHWSFEAPRRPPLPDVDHPSWNDHPIDRLLYERLRTVGMNPSPSASRETLIRRLSLDLTGLPPTLEDVSAFVNDTSSAAYETVVDRLLALPQYGERMAIDWLDAARYADTDGYQTDGTRSMWRWRDWVVDAFNANKPFDEFTVEQLAGDLLPDSTLEQNIATAFNRNNRTTAEGGTVEEEVLVEYAVDRASTTATVWLGLTMGCARCHDHKYDPLAQKEFYQFFAFFNNLPERGLVHNFGNDEPLIKAPTPDNQLELARLDAAVKEAESDMGAFEARIAEGIRDWSTKLKGSKYDDWSISEGLLVAYDFEKRKAPYVEWDVVPDGLVRGPNSFRVTPEGQRGSAGQLGGDYTTDLGDVAGFNYDERFSFSFWIRPDSENGAIFTRMHEAGREQGFGFYLDESKLRFEFTLRQTDHSMRIVAEEPFELGRWYHVALTYEGVLPASAGTNIYIDGKRRDFAVEWDDLKWPLTYSQPLKIGAGGGQLSIDGAIDGLRIYDRVLTSMEVDVMALDQPISTISAKPEAERTETEQEKLRLAYLDERAPKVTQQVWAALRIARQRRDLYYESIPTVMVMRERDEIRPAHVLNRGAYDAPGEEVQPGVPAALPPLTSKGRASRLDLAKWIVRRDNPLTARVTVNRYWQQLFGVGLVKTPNDFGSQGERPVQPALLDWLAVEFMESGWDVKAIFKTIVMSQAYRQSARVNQELLRRDPENRLLARGPRFRLPAEVIRDQALAAAGLLELARGGPPVKPYQPAGLWKDVSGASYEPDEGEALYRRSLYTFWKRTVPPPSMATFDASDRENCSVNRTRTNTPLQALALMNDVTYVEAARRLGERMLRDGGGSPAERITHGFRLVLARNPRPVELETLQSALADFASDYKTDRKAAKALVAVGESPRDRKLDPRELAAYATIASLLLNLDETVMKQ